MNTTNITGPDFAYRIVGSGYLYRGLSDGEFPQVIPVLEVIPCSDSSADSPAASGGTDGTTSSGPHTARTDGSADASAAASPAPDRPSVPEWCEKGVRQCGTGVQLRGTWPIPYHLKSDELAGMMIRDINSGLAALRADRDWWRKCCRENQDEFQELATAVIDTAEDLGLRNEDSGEPMVSDVVRKMRTRIRDLEAQVARQMATIDALTKTKAADDWRSECNILTLSDGSYTIASPSRKFFWAPRAGEWMSMLLSDTGGPFISIESAAQARLLIPTPPPDAAEGGGR